MHHDHPRAPQPRVDFRLLPCPETRVVERAQRIAALGASLLPTVDCVLLSITLDLRSTPPYAAIVPWDRRLTPREDLTPGLTMSVKSRRAFEALGKSTAALFDLLADRWPPRATPSRLGFVTDGTGVGFSSEDPIPLMPGWLSRHLSGRSSLVVVQPFARDGAWNQLISPAMSSLLQ